MKGVRRVRVKFKPEATCNDGLCSFSETGRRARRLAQAHVRTSGHTVRVVIEDSTVYAPERAS